ncbi:MAG: DUF4280 domain-containing protein [Motilibacteraceae bacterium]
MSGPAVDAGAMLSCSFGLAPATLNVLPTSRVMVEGKPVAAITDMAPAVNIPPFGMCQSLANPTVAAATTAALGVLTPMPCIPVPTGPWAATAPRTLVGGQPVLASPSVCTCAWGGVITITFPGTTRTIVG